MGHFLDTIEGSNVVESIDAGRQTSVEAEYLVVNQSSERKIVEKISEELPDVGVAVFAQALIVEAVDLCDLARLVVASQDSDALRVSDLKGNK